MKIGQLRQRAYLRKAWRLKVRERMVPLTSLTSDHDYSVWQ